MTATTASASTKTPMLAESMPMSATDVADFVVSSLRAKDTDLNRAAIHIYTHYVKGGEPGDLLPPMTYLARECKVATGTVGDAKRLLGDKYGVLKRNERNWWVVR